MLCKVVRPDFWTDFECLRYACPNHCCSGGCGFGQGEDEALLIVSKSSYYAIKNRKKTPAVERMINKYLTKLSRRDPEHYAFIQQIPDKSGHLVCPFHGISGDCALWSSDGYGVLPNVCRRFPERLRGVPKSLEGGVVDVSVDLGCFWVVRKLLSMELPMSFILEEHDVSELILAKKPVEHPFVFRDNDSYLHFLDCVLEHFWDVRILGLSVLQCRMYSMTDRVILLGLMMRRIGELECSRNTSEIGNLAEQMMLEKFKKHIRKTFNDISCNDYCGYRYGWKFCAMAAIDTNYPSFLEIFAEMSVTLTFGDLECPDFESDIWQTAHRYLDNYEKKHPHAMEQILVSIYHTQLHPYFITDYDSVSGNRRSIFWENTLLFGMLYAVLKTFVVGYLTTSSASEEIIEMAVVLFARRFLSDKALCLRIVELVHNEKADSVAFLALMMKSLAMSSKGDE